MDNEEKLSTYGTEEEEDNEKNTPYRCLYQNTDKIIV
jgi:hypothetical protein